MSRSLSSRAKASSFAQSTDEAWLVLLTISHATLATPIRVVNNNENITSNGNVFQSFPFEIELPGEDPDQVPRARLVIDNTDRTIVATVRDITTPPTITLQVILASHPDTIEIEFTGLTLREVEYNAESVSGQLVFESIYVEPVTYAMTPSRFPGMF